VANVLYLTYDGLSTGLAQSQILPYVWGLIEKGHHITIVSCEQGIVDPLTIHKLKEYGVGWYSVPYLFRYKPFHALYNVYHLRQLAQRIYRQGKYDIIHGRSQLATHIGLRIKKNSTRLLYDMRGFWADERVEGGIWNNQRWLFRRAYKYYKNQESLLLQKSDHIVVLTHAAQNYLINNNLTVCPISVIPCCVDEEKFNPSRFSDEDRQKIRQELAIPLDAPILVYIGSLGTWYMLDEMKAFFQTLLSHDSYAHFLVLTKDTDIAHNVLADLKPHVRILSVTSAEVPMYLQATDYGISFIRPTFAKTGSSPIKLGELWAMNKPVFCNGGYGDIDYWWQKHYLNGLIHKFCSDDYHSAIQALISVPTNDYRSIGHEIFGLHKGVDHYHQIYKALEA
jgi:glycosyltransferase involved in cell wall biosynthesis